MNAPASIHKGNQSLQAKYNLTSYLYDILDYPWERRYRKWRQPLLSDIRGTVLEAGVGTGHNLRFYHPEVTLIGIDLSPAMLKRARKRAQSASCACQLILEDAAQMDSIPSAHFDWVVSFFLCCVMPDHLQPLAIHQFERVLKPGGRFRLLEIVYSKNRPLRKRQELLAPWVERIYGARFDRDTVGHIQKSPQLKITKQYFLKDDTYLLIEGECEK